MANQTSIEWTDVSWQVTRGCERISPGCGGKNGVGGCYAEAIAGRFCEPSAKLPHPAFEGYATRGLHGGRWTGVVTPLMASIGEPLGWKEPQHVFTNSMSDLFHKDVSTDWIAAVFGVMAACPHITFQLLTKRAERMAEWFKWAGTQNLDVLQYLATTAVNHSRKRPIKVARGTTWPLPNVWLGVSIEDRPRKVRADFLRQCPAAVRWVSFEPLLEDLGHMDFTGISWGVVGGESGKGARPFRPEWARNLVKQMREAGVAPFVKQMGAHVVDRNDVGFDAENETLDDGTPLHKEAWPTPRNIVDGERWQGADVLVQLKSKKGGDMSEWPADLRVREWPREFPRVGA